MKSPAFRFYPADFMGSPDVQAMDLHEVGAYMFLLCMAWQSEHHGYLPDDDDKLRRWSHMTREQWDQSRESLLAKFPVVETGWRANARLIHEAKKTDRVQRISIREGKAGGRPKNPGNKAEIKPGVSDEKPELSVGLSPEKPSVSVSAFVSVFASDTASGDKDKSKDMSAPVEPHPEASLAGESDKRLQLISIETKQPDKRKRSQHAGYEPGFLSAYEKFPKHEEKSASESEWNKAIRRLQKGERNKPGMSAAAATEFIELAAADFAVKMADRDAQYIRSMRRWLRDSNYLDYEPEAKAEYYPLSPEEQAAQWDRDFGTAVNHG